MSDNDFQYLKSEISSTIPGGTVKKEIGFRPKDVSAEAQIDIAVGNESISIIFPPLLPVRFGQEASGLTGHQGDGSFLDFWCPESTRMVAVGCFIDNGTGSYYSTTRGERNVRCAWSKTSDQFIGRVVATCERF